MIEIKPVDYRANAREAVEFAKEVRADDYGSAEDNERVRLAAGRLLRWADERVRS